MKIYYDHDGDLAHLADQKLQWDMVSVPLELKTRLRRRVQIWRDYFKNAVNGLNQPRLL